MADETEKRDRLPTKSSRDSDRSFNDELGIGKHFKEKAEEATRGEALSVSRPVSGSTISDIVEKYFDSDVAPSRATRPSSLDKPEGEDDQADRRRAIVPGHLEARATREPNALQIGAGAGETRKRPDRTEPFRSASKPIDKYLASSGRRLMNLQIGPEQKRLLDQQKTLDKLEGRGADAQTGSSAVDAAQSMLSKMLSKRNFRGEAAPRPELAQRPSEGRPDSSTLAFNPAPSFPIESRRAHLTTSNRGQVADKSAPGTTERRQTPPPEKSRWSSDSSVSAASMASDRGQVADKSAPGTTERRHPDQFMKPLHKSGSEPNFGYHQAAVDQVKLKFESSRMPAWATKPLARLNVLAKTGLTKKRSEANIMKKVNETNDQMGGSLSEKEIATTKRLANLRDYRNNNIIENFGTPGPVDKLGSGDTTKTREAPAALAMSSSHSREKVEVRPSRDANPGAKSLEIYPERVRERGGHER
jgi:hypothetical protein